jgi:hypothetical protein
VLDYLEGMGDADYSPPGSILDHEEYKSRLSEAQRTSSVASPTPKSIRSHKSDLQDLANSQVSYDHRSPPPHMLRPPPEEDPDDADSNVQQRSENGTLPIVRSDLRREGECILKMYLARTGTPRSSRAPLRVL